MRRLHKENEELQYIANAYKNRASVAEEKLALSEKANEEMRNTVSQAMQIIGKK